MSSLTTELIKTKLASLDSTQESIVTVSSWLMFHRRSAPQIVDQWYAALQEGSANRKLNLIYLANEVSQQSRAKKRPEWPAAFATVLANAIEHVFRHSTTEVQNKLTRVVDVWKQRSVFTPEVLQEVFTRIQAPSKAANGASSGTIPNELKSISITYSQLQIATSSSSFALGTSNSLFDKLITSDSQRPSADLYAARLRHLSKSLESSQEAIKSSIALREDLVKGLQALEQFNFAALESEQNTLSELVKKSLIVAESLNQAERDTIRRSTTPEMERPQVEALTPPGSPPQDPVAKLQVELDPTLREIIGDEEEYIP